MRKPVLMIIAVLVVAAGTYVARWLTAPATVPAQPSGAALAPAFMNPPDRDRLIAAFEDRVAANPDPLDLRFLGQLYLDRARATGDLAAYGLAEQAFTQALERSPSDLDSQTLLASTAYSLHDFRRALDLATRVHQRDPNRMGALAVIGDAQAALGDYRAAQQTYEALAARLPGTPAVQVRQSRLAWTMDEVEEAESLADAAVAGVDIGSGHRRELAWYQSFRSQLAFDSGHISQAVELGEEATANDAGSFLAFATLARAQVASGLVEEAIEHYQRATEGVPHPEYLTELGDVYLMQGEDQLAEAQFETVEVIGTLAEANRQVYNRQLALFYADHDRRAEEALRLASAEIEARTDVGGYDALAWALYRNGRFAEARQASDQALSLGTPEARMWYHAGLISAALGDERRALAELRRALEINPRFHPLQSEEARRWIGRLSA